MQEIQQQIKDIPNEMNFQDLYKNVEPFHLYNNLGHIVCHSTRLHPQYNFYHCLQFVYYNLKNHRL